MYLPQNFSDELIGSYNPILVASSLSSLKFCQNCVLCSYSLTVEWDNSWRSTWKIWLTFPSRHRPISYPLFVLYPSSCFFLRYPMRRTCFWRIFNPGKVFGFVSGHQTHRDQNNQNHQQYDHYYVHTKINVLYNFEISYCWNGTHMTRRKPISSKWVTKRSLYAIGSNLGPSR